MDPTLINEYFSPVIKQSFAWIVSGERILYEPHPVHVKLSVFTQFICHESCGACCLAVVNKPGLNLMEFLPSEKSRLDDRAAIVQEEDLVIEHPDRAILSKYRIYLEDVKKDTTKDSPLRIFGDYKYTCKHLGERGECKIFPYYCMGSQIPPLAGWFNKKTGIYEWENWPFLGRRNQTKRSVVDEKDIIKKKVKRMGETVEADVEVVDGKVLAARLGKTPDNRLAVKTLYNYTQIDGTYGTLCQQPGTITIESANSTRKKFRRIKEWTDYLELETWLPEILDWAGPLDTPWPTADWRSF